MDRRLKELQRQYELSGKDLEYATHIFHYLLRFGKVSPEIILLLDSLEYKPAEEASPLYLEEDDYSHYRGLKFPFEFSIFPYYRNFSEISEDQRIEYIENVFIDSDQRYLIYLWYKISLSFLNYASKVVLTKKNEDVTESINMDWERDIVKPYKKCLDYLNSIGPKNPHNMEIINSNYDILDDISSNIFDEIDEMGFTEVEEELRQEEPFLYREVSTLKKVVNLLELTKLLYKQFKVIEDENEDDFGNPYSNDGVFIYAFDISAINITANAHSEALRFQEDWKDSWSVVFSNIVGASKFAILWSSSSEYELNEIHEIYEEIARDIMIRSILDYLIVSPHPQIYKHGD